MHFCILSTIRKRLCHKKTKTNLDKLSYAFFEQKCTDPTGQRCFVCVDLLVYGGALYMVSSSKFAEGFKEELAE